nr:hypothetical protein [Streptomyces sp. RPA4-2]QIY61415.1 hypothetical protein HEP85_06705 [Streptomyces sp. RPA4-2]
MASTVSEAAPWRRGGTPPSRPRVRRVGAGRSPYVAADPWPVTTGRPRPAGRPTGSVTDGVTATVDVTATVYVNVRKKGTAP